MWVLARLITRSLILIHITSQVYPHLSLTHLEQTHKCDNKFTILSSSHVWSLSLSITHTLRLTCRVNTSSWSHSLRQPVPTSPQMSTTFLTQRLANTSTVWEDSSLPTSRAQPLPSTLDLCPSLQLTIHLKRIVVRLAPLHPRGVSLTLQLLQTFWPMWQTTAPLLLRKTRLHRLGTLAQCPWPNHCLPLVHGASTKLCLHNEATPLVRSTSTDQTCEWWAVATSRKSTNFVVQTRHYNIMNCVSIFLTVGQYQTVMLVYILASNTQECYINPQDKHRTIVRISSLKFKRKWLASFELLLASLFPCSSCRDRSLLWHFQPITTAAKGWATEVPSSGCHFFFFGEKTETFICLVNLQALVCCNPIKTVM